MIYPTQPEYPDYSAGGFEQYCYQTMAPSTEYFYSGSASYPVTSDPYSRRNIPQQPVQQTPQFAQGIPQAPQTNWGFNQMAESRRNIQPMAPMQPAPVPFTPAPAQQSIGAWGPPPQIGAWSMQAPMQFSAPVPSIDQECLNAAFTRQNIFYEQPQCMGYAPPAIDWSNKQAINLNQPKYQPVQFPAMAQPETQVNWVDLVNQNFATK